MSTALHRKTPRKLHHDHGIGHGPVAGNADQNSGHQSHLNDGRRFATFMMARTPHRAVFIEKPDSRIQLFRVADDQGRSRSRRMGLAEEVHR